MTYDDRIIVLNTTRVKENSIVLHTISRTYGRRSFLVHVGKNAGMSYFLPLNLLEVSVTENPKSDLWYARVVSAEAPLNSIRDNIYKNTISLFMAEVLFRIVKQGNAEDGLYDWCRRQILTLDALETDFSNFHIRFLLELAVALGFRPQVNDILPFTGEYQSVIESFMTSSLAESMLIPLSGQVRNDLASSLIRYLEFHTESTINIRSLAVLRELFG
ncbi:MAG: DNA repair protein RecO [Candidatus Cryptobacteroides sp.]